MVDGGGAAYEQRMKKVLLPLAVLVPFTIYSCWVVYLRGYFGFIDVAWREPWGGQIFLDLCIAMFLVASFIRRDAPKHGISPWPYLVAIPALGSIAVLAYFVHRGVRSRA